MSNGVDLMLRLVLAVSIVTALSASLPQFAADQTSKPPAPGRAVVTGRVLDVDTLQPVSVSVVTLMGQGSPRATITDGYGRFRLADVPSGGAALFASKRGYLDWQNTRRPWDPGNRIELKDGETRTDVVLYLLREAVISGRVFDEWGHPVVGVELTVMSRTFVAGRPVFRRVERHRKPPRTDDRGMYRIPALVPGEYLVAAELVERTIPETALARPPKGPQDPLSSAIYAVSDLVASQGGVFAGSGQTMSVGRSVRVIGSGPVAPPASDGRVQSYPTTYFPGVTLGSAATLVVLRAGDDLTGIDIPIRPVTTVSVSGTVSGPRGPVAHLPLFLLPGAGPGTSPGTNAGTDEEGLDALPVARTMSDDRGVFIFPMVPPGQYRVHALKTPAPPRDTDSWEFTAIEVSGAGGQVAVRTGGERALETPRTDPAAADMVWASKALTVGDRNLTNVSIEAIAGARVSGRVAITSSSAEAGRRLKEGFTIVLERADGHDPQITMSPNPFRSAGWTMSEPDGTFSTRPLPPGRYVVRALDARGWPMKSAMLGSRNVADTPIDLRADDVTDVVVTLTDSPTVVAGMVRAAGKGRLDRLAVIAFPADRTGWFDFGISPWRVRTAIVMPDGQYELRGLPAGVYYVSVAEDQMGLENANAARLAGLTRTSTRITLGDGEHERLDLQAPTRR